MANFCNQYYTNVGVDILKNVPTMYLTLINENDLINYINDLKNNSSAGVDAISSKIIKVIQSHIIPLKHIINNPFKTGIVPNPFKVLVITPISTRQEVIRTSQILDPLV